MRSENGVIHEMANCLECDWTCDDYTKARRSAYNHSKNTGHTTECEVARIFKYYGSEK